MEIAKIINTFPAISNSIAVLYNVTQLQQSTDSTLKTINLALLIAGFSILVFAGDNREYNAGGYFLLFLASHSWLLGSYLAPFAPLGKQV